MPKTLYFAGVTYAAASHRIRASSMRKTCITQDESRRHARFADRAAVGHRHDGGGSAAQTRPTHRRTGSRLIAD